MDEVFANLVGRTLPLPGKVITIVADNFSFLEESAKFLRAIITTINKQNLHTSNISKRWIQIGNLHCELERMLNSDDANWSVNKYQQDDRQKDLCDRLADDIPTHSTGVGRSLLVVNDASRLLLASHSDEDKQRKLLKIIDTWKRSQNHFVVVLIQSTQLNAEQTFLKRLQYISDAYVNNLALDEGFLQVSWYQPAPTVKTLMPPLVKTCCYTCKIDKSYTFTDYELRNRNSMNDLSGLTASKPEEKTPVETLERLALEEDDDDDDAVDTTTSTLPYIRAQDPEQSKIFYYPDKDDDVDEEDPDNDLNL